MIDLRRGLAPVSDAAWSAVDAEARRVLKLNLAGRKLVDFRGPLGWSAASVNLGRAADVEAITQDVRARLRRSQPLVELCAFADVAREQLDDIDRGALDPDLAPVITAAEAVARAEDTAIFSGYPAATIRGIMEASPHRRLQIAEDYAAYPATVSEALEVLRDAGVAGPYALALGPRCYAGLMRALEPGGYPVYHHVRRLVDDRVVRAPAIDGAVVLGVGSGDYELTVGQDVSIAYLSHDDAAVRLALIESFTFRVLRPEAAVVLSYAAAGA